MEDTQKLEEPKVGIHSQHARLMKEDEETWISSEDLNTENSSDEEKNKTLKRRTKLKTRKRSTPSIKLQKVPGYTTSILPSLVRPATDRPPMEGPSHSQDTDDDTFPDDISLPTISSTARSSITKLENLEDWRPTKGALASVVGISDGGSNARKLMNEASNFHKIMSYKMKSLKSCLVLDSEAREEINRSLKNDNDTELKKTFKYLKNTPEVKAKLKSINDMEEEIEKTIEHYKVERADRLATELEVCKDICKTKIPMEHDTESFLRLCSFDRSQYDDQAFAEKANDSNLFQEEMDTEDECETDEPTIEHCPEGSKESMISEGKSDYFIRKNLHAAKEGVMAALSLTDEQKSKIAELLEDLDNFHMEQEDCENKQSELPLAELNEDENLLSHKAFEAPPANLSDYFKKNAFKIDDPDKLRLNEINSELGLHFSDCPSADQNGPIPSVSDEAFWKQFVLAQQLKDIDNRLSDLYKTYAEDEARIREFGNCVNNFQSDLQESDEETLNIDYNKLTSSS